jgi:hypothetical protein
VSLRETQGLAKPLPKRYGQRFGILVTHRDEARSVASLADHEDAMDASKFAEPHTFHADGGWHDAYWLRQARAHAARSIARFVTASAARLCRWAANMIWAREALSAIPAEGSPCLQGDEVGRARQLLLGQEDPLDRAS